MRLGEGIDWTGTKPKGKVRRVRTVERDDEGNIVTIREDNRRHVITERDANGDILTITEYEDDEA